MNFLRLACAKPEKRERAITARRKRTNGGGCERERVRTELQTTEIEVQLEKGVEGQT